MKTYIVVLALLVLNTSALLSEPILAFVKDINPWLFVSIEIVLLVTFYINNQLKGLSEIANIDLSGIDLFVVNSKEKTQGKQ